MQVTPVTSAPSTAPIQEQPKPLPPAPTVLKDTLSPKQTNSFDAFFLWLWNMIKQIFCFADAPEKLQTRELTAEIEKFFNATSIDVTTQKMPSVKEVKEAHAKLSEPAKSKIKEFVPNQNIDAALEQPNHTDLGEATTKALRSLRGCL